MEALEKNPALPIEQLQAMYLLADKTEIVEGMKEYESMVNELTITQRNF
jgi:hypothetical protein